MRHISSGRLGSMLVGAIAAAFICAGCTPWATYPPVEGSVDMSSSSLSPIPELMAEAIWYAHARDGRGDEIVFNLPEGTPQDVYGRIQKRLEGGRPMREIDEPAYHVVEVRVRTVDSEVDVIHPDNDGNPQQITIAFRQNLLTGFRVERVRVWRYHVEAPPPHYRFPEPEEAEEVAVEDGA
jgi:hypothetical protein